MTAESVRCSFATVHFEKHWNHQMTDDVAKLNARNGSPLMDGLGIRIVIEDGVPLVRVDIDEKHLRSHNIAHGGLTCTILDTAMGAVAYAAFRKRLEREQEANQRTASDKHDTSNKHDKSLTIPEETELVTSQLTIHFIRPAWKGESIVGRGHIVHYGSKTIVVRGEVTTNDGQTVASGSGTFMPVSIAAKSEN